MHAFSPKLFFAVVTGEIIWLRSTQNIAGTIGAVVGAFSAVMLVCINWEKFLDSKPVRLLRAFFNRKNQ